MHAARTYKDFVVKRESSVSPPGWDHSSETERPLDYSRQCPNTAGKGAVQRRELSEPCSPDKKEHDSNSDSEQGWIPRHEVVAPFPLRIDPRYLMTGLPLLNSTAMAKPHIDPQYYQYQQALLQQISKNTQRVSSLSSVYPTSGILVASNRQSTEAPETSDQSDHSDHSRSDASSGPNDTNDTSSLTSGNVRQSCDSSTTPTSYSSRAERKRAKAFPDELKDSAYWERRRRNNAAAKRSRDARRAKEDETAVRAAYLEQENLELRVETNTLRKEIERMRNLISQIPMARP